MSQVPNDPSSPQYAAYPRGQQLYGSVAELKLLAEGYFGLNVAFLASIVVLATTNFLARDVTQTPVLGIYLLGFTLNGLIVGVLSYGPNKKIGTALSWSPSAPAIASILLGLQAWICCGAIGFIIIQGKAAKEMQKYGLKPGFAGFKKKEVDQVIRQLEQQQAAPPVVPPSYQA